MSLRSTLPVLLVAGLAACGGDDNPTNPNPTPPPLNGTAFIDPDILTIADPTVFDSVADLGAGSRDMFDSRTAAVGTYDVWLFRAHYSDSTTIEMQVNSEFDSLTAADFARVYSQRIGLLPFVLREDLESTSIHDGEAAFRGADGNLVVHTDQGELYRLQGHLEEVIAHETVHISLDDEHATAPGYLAAAAADPTAISNFAAQFPEQEDFAETFGAWLGARWAQDGLTQFLIALITQAVPNRLDYLDGLDLDMSPLER